MAILQQCLTVAQHYRCLGDLGRREHFSYNDLATVLSLPAVRMVYNAQDQANVQSCDFWSQHILRQILLLEQLCNPIQHSLLGDLYLEVASSGPRLQAGFVSESVLSRIIDGMLGLHLPILHMYS